MTEEEKQKMSEEDLLKEIKRLETILGFHQDQQALEKNEGLWRQQVLAMLDRVAQAQERQALALETSLKDLEEDRK